VSPLKKYSGSTKVGYEMLARTVDVEEDLMVQVEALLSPDQCSDDRQVWM
jgi:hypothetical protein